MKNIFCFVFIIQSIFFFSQEKDTQKKVEDEIERDIIQSNIVLSNNKNHFITPNQAALYSAVLPGLGQYYNHKYWKIPIVWGALGTGVGFIIWNQKQYKRYDRAFQASLRNEPHEFSNINGVTSDVLGNTMDSVKRQRDYAIAITLGLYALNILDAVVDAHLAPQKKDPDLAVSPVILNQSKFVENSESQYGLSLIYKF